MTTITIGSRDSRLAVVQTETVRDYIANNLPGITPEILTMKTTGDIILDRPLEKVGGKGLFVPRFLLLGLDLLPSPFPRPLGRGAPVRTLGRRGVSGHCPHPMPSTAISRQPSVFRAPLGSQKNETV